MRSAKGADAARSTSCPARPRCARSRCSRRTCRKDLRERLKAVCARSPTTRADSTSGASPSSRAPPQASGAAGAASPSSRSGLPLFRLRPRRFRYRFRFCRRLRAGTDQRLAFSSDGDSLLFVEGTGPRAGALGCSSKARSADFQRSASVSQGRTRIGGPLPLGGVWPPFHRGDEGALFCSHSPGAASTFAARPLWAAFGLLFIEGMRPRCFVPIPRGPHAHSRPAPFGGVWPTFH